MMCVSTVWDVEMCEAKEIKRVEIAYEGHTNKVSCIDFSGHHLITGSWVSECGILTRACA